MKSKQIIGIIVAGLMFIAICVTGILSNVVTGQLLATQNENESSLVDSVLKSANLNTVTLPTEDFIGVVNIVGTIQGSSSSGLSSNEYNHDLYMDYIEQMIKADNNKGILLYVDSPGGAVYQSDELYLKLMEYKETTGRPIYAYFASQACSGGYYIAMAADKIYANRNCWTGSIGVIVSLTNCKKLYDKLGIKEIDITSGKNKAMGSIGLDLTDEQYDILQGLVDEAFDQFVDIVSEGRDMGNAAVRKLADGRIYSARQAKENGLIDEIGSLEEEKVMIEQEPGVGSNITYFEPDSGNSDFFSRLFGMAEQLKSKTEVDLAEDIMNNNGNGVLMYYAD